MLLFLVDLHIFIYNLLNKNYICIPGIQEDELHALNFELLAELTSFSWANVHFYKILSEETPKYLKQILLSLSISSSVNQQSSCASFISNFIQKYLETQTNSLAHSDLKNLLDKRIELISEKVRIV